MCGRISELAAKYDISTERLDIYEEAGLLKPIHLEGEMFYCDLRVAVLAKAEKLGFSVEDIRNLIQSVEVQSTNGLSCAVCYRRGAFVS